MQHNRVARLPCVDNSLDLHHWTRAQEIAEHWRHNPHALIDQLQGTTTQSRQAELEDHDVGTIERLEQATLNDLRCSIKSASTDELARIFATLEAHGRVTVELNRKQRKVYCVRSAASRRTVEAANRREDHHLSTIDVDSADAVNS